MASEHEQTKEILNFFATMATPGKRSPGNEDSHYFGEIEPLDFVEAQGLGHHEGNIIKYITRWKYKGGILDLMKAAWFLMRLIKLETKKQELASQQAAVKDAETASSQER